MRGFRIALHFMRKRARRGVGLPSNETARGERRYFRFSLNQRIVRSKTSR